MHQENELEGFIGAWQRVDKNYSSTFHGMMLLLHTH